MNSNRRFDIGDKIFDKWFSSEWRVKEIRNPNVVLESMGDTQKILILSESALKDVERFQKLA
jgi:hypothetical protein